MADALEVAATRLLKLVSGPLLVHTTLAVQQPWCCPCLRIKPEAAGTYPARLQACRAWGLAAAQRLLGRAAVSLNAAMLAMLAHQTVPGRSRQWLRKPWPGARSGRVAGGKCARQRSAAVAASQQWRQHATQPASLAPPQQPWQQEKLHAAMYCCQSQLGTSDRQRAAEACQHSRWQRQVRTVCCGSHPKVAPPHCHCVNPIGKMIMHYKASQI